MADAQQPVRLQIKAMIIARASQDETYANEVRRDPRGVVQREMKSMGIHRGAAGERTGERGRGDAD